jgi:hypothetical protein
MCSTWPGVSQDDSMNNKDIFCWTEYVWILYLRVYKLHLLIYLPKSGCGLYTEIKTYILRKKSRYHIDDWAHDAGIVCCKNPSRDR